MSVLSVAGLDARLGTAHILRGIDLAVDKGRVTALLGRNGAGKTTTMKTIMGWVRPTGGRVLFEGRDITGLATDRVARAGIGFIPEDRRIFAALTVEENLRLGLFQRGFVGAREAGREVARMCSWFPRLDERRAQAGRTLSGGEQQMLAIARGLIGRPRLVLIDEPTEGLAPMIVREIFDAIRRMTADGISVLLVEQNVRGAMQVADHCVVIDRGCTVAAGRPEDIETDQDVQRRLTVA